MRRDGVSGRCPRGGWSDAGNGWPSLHGDGQQGSTTVYWEDQLSLPIFHLPPSCTTSMVPVVFFLSESSALTVSVAPVAVFVSLTILTLVSVPIILIISNICARSAGGVAWICLVVSADMNGITSSIFFAASNAFRYCM